MKTLSKILKEFQILNHLKTNIIGKKNYPSKIRDC